MAAWANEKADRVIVVVAMEIAMANENQWAAIATAIATAIVVMASAWVIEMMMKTRTGVCKNADEEIPEVVICRTVGSGWVLLAHS